MKNIAIIGAGFGGMAAAYDLVNAGNKVTVYESSDQVGGLASGIKEDHWDWSVEKFYHHWFASDEYMLGLIEELGLSDKVLFPRPYTVLLYKDKWYPFDSIMQALLFPGLGWGINKIRFGLVGVYLRLTKNWRELEKYTVDEWMRKYAGAKVYELMWEPMLIGKFGEKYAKQVNMAWFWARIHARTTKLGTYQGGFQAFSDDFAQILTAKNVEIKLNTAVNSIKHKNGTIKVATDTGSQQYDQVLVTSSPAILSQLAPELPKEYVGQLLELKSMGAAVMIFSLKEQLSKEGYYWYNIPKSSGYPFLAMVEHTNYVSEEHFGGDHILYCGDYREQDHEYFSMSEKEIEELFIAGIKKINPGFDENWIKRSWLFRSKYAQPVPLLDHSQNIPEIKTPMNGLHFASMSQVYPWDRGTNFAVEIGRRAAKLMMDK